MNKQMSPFFILCFVFITTFSVQAQKLNQNYLNYIGEYSGLAVSHMKLYKIPASITLAQGLLESGAGMSQFVKKSNNHFGIKCHNNWKGERVYHNDDNPNDCFRKYKRAEDSFEDHSRFLTERPRYANLFKLDIKDYKAWAKGLQQSGYATDKAYANKLIKIIEDYSLYQYDEINLKKGKQTKKQNRPISAPLRDRSVYKTFGLIYVIAGDNDSFDGIASDLNFDVEDLLKYNEVHLGFPLHKGDIVYLEKKKKKADKPYYEHVIKIGESMHSISQKYGIQISSLYKINKKDSDYVPEEGNILRLR